ncbi:Esterase/Lipase [Mycena kentingensis (nom. inval.)]|nr:Esterase/Lipase [Mycena kentingensis (nom. inval.)]
MLPTGTQLKQIITQRGLTYGYHFTAAAEGKPTLLLLHGFPTPAYVWAKTIAFFEPLGFGIVAPDLLGYGGTDKPTDPKVYIGTGLAQDVVDILDAEKVESVIAVGHDWGSRIVSRMANYHPERLVACAFYGIGYSPPAQYYGPRVGQIQATIGYNNIAYMEYFVEAGAHVTMEKNIDSFLALLFPVDDETWREVMCNPGGAKAWIEGNKAGAVPSYMSAEEREYYREALLDGGLCAPLCWYKIFMDPSNAEDDAKAPESTVTLTKPVLFVAFNKDPIGVPLLGTEIHAEFVKPATNITNKEVDADHWAVLSHAEQLNGWLLEWIQALK